MSEQQLAAFLFSALLASASLLVSAFGNLYSVYVKAVSDELSICKTLRKLCYMLAVTIFVITLTAGGILLFLSQNLDQIIPYLHYIVLLILAIINISPLRISWMMFSDSRA